MKTVINTLRLYSPDFNKTIIQGLHNSKIINSRHTGRKCELNLTDYARGIPQEQEGAVGVAKSRNTALLDLRKFNQ